MEVSQSETSSGRNNNASEGVDENIWKVHAVTKQQSKHECTGEEPSYERGKSHIHLFVRVLKFVVRNHLRFSHPPRLFHATKHILIPLKVQTPK
jgi:hypothetical protein